MSIGTITERSRALALTPPLIAFLASPRLRRTPHRMFRVLQRFDPVHCSPLGVTVLSRHADVSATLRNSRFGSDEAKADLAQLRIIERFDRLIEQRCLDRADQ